MQAKHLEHWGINMMSMQKTEKTMAELQIDLNMSFEFDKITESGESLQPLSGPGYALLLLERPSSLYLLCDIFRCTSCTLFQHPPALQKLEQVWISQSA